MVQRYLYLVVVRCGKAHLVKVTIADIESFCVTRKKRTGNADFFVITEQTIRVIEFKCQANNCGNRCKRNVRLSKVSRIPITSSPSHLPLQTTPRSGIEPASEPASGLVSAKQGISLPTANLGK